MGCRALFVGAALTAAVLLLLTGCAPARYDGPVSDHFDGREFHNEAPFPHKFSDLLGYVFSREKIEWPRDESVSQRPAPVERVGVGGLRLTWVNHATLLIQADNLNLLTDPIWSERASPLSFVGPERHHPPGIPFSNLPPIDVVMISHSHYDHMDFPTLKRLHAEHDPLFVVPLGNAVLLESLGIERIVELDWWQGVSLSNGCSLNAAEVQHWSNRRMFPSDRNLSLWAGFVLETTGGPVYFGGDSGYGPHYRQTRGRYGAMRAAMLPIGAYLPRWFMAYQHMGPAEAVQAHQDLAAQFSLGIHWGAFKLSVERRFQAVEDLALEIKRSGLDERDFIAPAVGAHYDVQPLPGATGCR